MLSKPITILKDGKLLGYIRLQTDMLDRLEPDDLMVLERVLNKGDSTIVTFRLNIHKAMMER